MNHDGRPVPELTLSEPYFIIQRDGAVVGAPAAGGAPRPARAAGAAVGAADRVRERAAPPQQLGPPRVAGCLSGEAVHLPLHRGGRHRPKLPILRSFCQGRASLEFGAHGHGQV